MTYTEIGESEPVARFSTAPNGSSSGTDYHTVVIVRQDWTDVPANGVYAGRSYRIRQFYISPDPRHPRSQYIGSDSSPWQD